MENVKENKMGTMPVNKLLITMALPMMISMLVQALYNIVDSVFVAQINEDALTAVSMAFPIQNILIGTGNGIGIGTTALLSRALGEKRPGEANKVAMHGIILAICAFVIYFVLGLFIIKPFYRAQGASDIITEYGQQYLSVVMLLSFGIFTQLIGEKLLQSTGRTILSMFTQGLGAIVNIILDPIMIFGYFGCPAMGVTGAAVATVIGQCCSGALAVFFNLKMNKEIHFYVKGLKLQAAEFGRILYIGVPTMIMVGVGSVMTFGVNKILMAFTSTAVAVFGVYFKLQSFAFMPLFGMNGGMVPIIGFNLGARKPDRIMKTLKLSIFYAVCIMLICFAVFQIFTPQLLGFFSASEDMLAIGVPAIRTISLSFIVAGFCVISGSYFQALGNGIFSMLVSVFRQLVFLLPMVYIFSLSGNINMVWYAWPLAECVAVCTCTVFHIILYKKIIKPLKESTSV